MGKIINALMTAEGDIPELVLRCLDDYVPDTPIAGLNDTREPGARRGALAQVIEPSFDRPPVVQLRQRSEATFPVEEERKEPATRTVSLRISDSSPLLSPKADDRRSAEQYRIIRTRVFHQLQGASVTVVSSPGIGDGKTVTALNLAAVLARKDESKVILVDADLRLSKVSDRLGRPDGPGLAGVLAGACTLEEAIVRVEQLPNFYILPAGHADSNPTELLDSSNWRQLIARLREEFQRTIVDSPPVEVVADYDLIASVCDGVILVVRPDHTPRPALANALAKVKNKLTGILINDAEDWLLWRTKSSSYYYYRNNGSGKAKSGAAK